MASRHPQGISGHDEPKSLEENHEIQHAQESSMRQMQMGLQDQTKWSLSRKAGRLRIQPNRWCRFFIELCTSHQ
jgi:hypothetical protein